MTSALWDKWPVFSCLLVVLGFLVSSFIVAFKYEGRARGGKVRARGRPVALSVIAADGTVFSDEVWTAGGGWIHPGWLLAFRAFAFLYLVPIQLYDLIRLGPSETYYYYTQWTFSLLTVYFGLAAGTSAVNVLLRIPETKVAPEAKALNLGEVDSLLPGKEVGKASTRDAIQEAHRWCGVPDAGTRTRGGFWSYALQVLFQVLGPAVLLTDSVYWLLLVPFVLPADFEHDFVDINMHAMNALFFVIELFLNDMRFPWFRGAYLVMWSVSYISFQWFLHFSGSAAGWPYPFLSLSTPYAPAWYLALSLFHLICFIICLLLAKVKQNLQERLNLVRTFT